MVNDNDGGTRAGRLPSPYFSLAQPFRAALQCVGARWQRFLADDCIRPHATIAAAPGTADELRTAVGAFHSALVGVAIATGLINVLSLTGPLFMLQVYDRVLPSRSVPTLVGLALLALVMFAFQGVIDLLRGRILLRIGRALDEKLSARVFEIVIRAPLQTRSASGGLQPVRDLDNVRSFMSSMGLTAFFDLPWMPLYIAVCFLFHPLMGFAVLLGAIIICSLTLLTEALTQAPNRASVALAAARHKLAEAGRRNAALLQALGMRGRMTDQWLTANEHYLQTQHAANDMVAGFGSLSRVLRVILQATVLGVGAYLVINQEATAGVMLAATILAARALAPVELVIANWRSFITARQSWRRLSEALTAVPIEQEWIALPPPSRNLRLTAITIVPPGMGGAALHDVSFTLIAGNALGVIGPSGSGKTALARALVGVWKPVRGTIRLDGATLDQWSPDSFGRFIGYLPQEVELFEGTVAQNIARFEANAAPEKLIEAATAAGVHDVILRLPQGYKTEVGEGGAMLSGGQRQRIALARALYGNPFLVVLDEPNSNLDTLGEQALTKAIAGIRARGGIALVIAHRPSAVAAVDHILVLNEGRVQAFGPRDQILQQVLPPAATSAEKPSAARGMKARRP